jgi:hypothetical protein
MGEADIQMSPDDMGRFFGPQQIDQMVRQAVHTCWSVLPPERRTVQNVETEVRRIVERALKDMREDAQAFGFEP